MDVTRLNWNLLQNNVFRCKISELNNNKKSEFRLTCNSNQNGSDLFGGRVDGRSKWVYSVRHPSLSYTSSWWKPLSLLPEQTKKRYLKIISIRVIILSNYLFPVQISHLQSRRAQWNSPSPALQCSPVESLDSRAPSLHRNDTYWDIYACYVCLKHLWYFLCQK